MSDPAVPMERDDDAVLAALLHAHAPAALADDGFVARTMHAVALADPSPARVRRLAPMEIARALAREQQRHDAQARRWHWALAGVAVGALLMVVAVLTAPGGVMLDPASGSLTVAAFPQWVPLWTLLAIGAIWVAWRQFRAD